VFKSFVFFAYFRSFSTQLYFLEYNSRLSASLDIYFQGSPMVLGRLPDLSQTLPLFSSQKAMKALLSLAAYGGFIFMALHISLPLSVKDPNSFFKTWNRSQESC